MLNELDLRSSFNNNVYLKNSIRVKNGIPRVSNLLFFVHGFNNERDDANVSYIEFADILKKFNPNITESIICLHWPGNYKFIRGSQFLFYPQIIKRAKSTAQELSFFLKKNFHLFKNKKITFIAHSLGSRLVIETLANLFQSKFKDVNINIFLMAAAIPNNLVSINPRLKQGLKMANGGKTVMFSKGDRVLRYAFRAGQKIEWGEESSEAVGLYGKPEFNTWDKRVNLSPYGHSDYWVSETSAKEIVTKLKLKTTDYEPPRGRFKKRFFSRRKLK
jgi:esterase/lipase superfamily enzyme